MVLQKDTKFDLSKDVSDEELTSIKDSLDKHLNTKKTDKSSLKIKLKRGGLRTKAAIIAAFLGTVPVFIVGGITYFVADNVIATQVAKDKVAESSKIADQVNRFFAERIANTKTLVKLVKIIAPEFPKINVAEKKALEDALTQFYLDYLVFENITIYDLKGNVLLQSKQSAPELNQRKFPYFQEVLKSNNIVISQPIEFKGEFAIYIASSLKNTQGKPVGVLAGKIPINWIGNALLKSGNLVQGTSYKIVNSEGEILLNFQDPDNLPLGTNIGDKLTLFNKYNQNKKAGAWREAKPSNSPLNAYVPVKTINDINWGIITSTKASLAFSAQQSLLQTIIIGTLITAAVTAALGIIWAIISVLPINKLTEIVTQLGEGKLDKRAPITGDDEIAILGENINKMASEIEKLLALNIQESLELQKQNEILAELSRNEALIQGDASKAVETFIETIAKVLDVSRVGVWLYDTEINCLVSFDLYNLVDNEHIQRIELKTEEIDDYLQALRENNIIETDDINQHSLTQKLASVYLHPNDIISLLAIPLTISGNTIGVLTCEEVKYKRKWKPQELTLVTSIANLISLVFESQTNQTEIVEILDVVSQVEDGDLTVKAKVSDRTTGLVADTLNRLIEQLAEILQKVYISARKVTKGVKISQGIAKYVAQNSIVQVNSVQEVLNLSQQVEAAALSSAQEVETSKQDLVNLSKVVTKGEQTITKLREGINSLSEGSEHIIQEIKALGEFVGLAEQFVQDQNEIAQKTQVLALNASLVATRAAQQQNPRRFAQVAQEFQNIAEQVSLFAQQTNEDLELLEKRTTQINKVVSFIDTEVQDLGNLVDEFTNGVQESDQIFRNVSIVTNQAINRGEAIATKNEDIIESVKKTIVAIQKIAKIAENTSNKTKKTLSQTKEMEKLSTELLQIVEFFKLPL